MKFLINLAVIGCLLLGVQSSARAQQNEKTLLWRISGNGLKQPSYLFGTIHLRAKKLFNFPDSLYAAIDNTQVFALEVNPDSMNNMVTDYANKLLSKKDVYGEGKKKEKTLREILTPAELKTLRENLPPGSDIDPEELTVKQAYLMKDKLLTQKAGKDDLPTFMDGYLYSIAKDKGKALAGVERAEDQLNLLEKMDFSDADPKKVVNYVHNGASVQDKMTALYVQKDLDGLLRLSDMIPEKQQELLLTARNKNMLRSMDSIMQTQTLFCAVGTLHLPGKNGLIALLRAKGYTVSPVLSSTFINGADYTFKPKGSNWVDVVSEQDGYSIKMPAKPNDVNAGSGTIVMKMYYDLSTSVCYITNHTNIPENTTVSRNEIMDAMAAKMTADGKNVDHKDITNGTLTGREYIFTGKSDVHYHVQLLANKTDVYMLMVYSQSALKNNDAFFKSFQLKAKSESVNSLKSFDDIHVKASLPDNKPTRSVTYTEDSTDKQTMYTIVDPTIGNYYFITCSEAQPGYNYNNDTVFLYNLKSYLKGLDITATIDKGTFNGNNSYDYITSSFKGVKIKGKLVFAGNREYHLLVQISDNEKSLATAETFLKSVEISLPAPSAIHKEKPEDGKFSCYVPAALSEHSSKITNPETTGTNVSYEVYDENTLITYFVSVNHLNPYYWKVNDTVMLKAWLSKNMIKSDYKPVYSYYELNGMPCGEMVATKKYSDKIHRIKVIGDGQTRYILDCTYPSFLKDNKQVDSFYSSFTILKKDTRAMRPSSTALFADLHSTDSATNATAADAIGEVNFSKDDIPLLLKELSTTFPDDANSNGGHYTAAQLMRVLKSFPSAITSAQLEHLYHEPLTASRGQQFDVLSIIAEQKDSFAAYATLKQLLLASPPTSGAQYVFMSSMAGHNTLIKTLFPELLQQCGDSIAGFMVCTMACNLIEGNYLKKKEFENYIGIVVDKSSKARGNRTHMPNTKIIELLALLGTKETIDEVKQYQFTSQNYMRYTAVSILTDSMQQPAPAALDSIAADKNYRLRLYRMLNEKNMAGLFPKRYLKQDLFGESYLSETDDDDYYTNYKLLGSRIALYKGKKQKFYLYKANYDDGEATQYLGVVGPFSNDPNVLTIDEDDRVCSFSEEKFDLKQIDNQLKVLLIKKKISDSRND